LKTPTKRPGHKLLPEEQQRRLDVYRQGLTDKQAAEILEIPMMTFAVWRIRQGLKPINKRKKKKPEPLENFKVRETDKPSPEELAEYKRWLREWAGVE
jgi:hypothetical protein